MSRFWQVVYSFGHAFRNWKEILGGWQDRILLAMKKPAAKVVLAVVAALFIIAFLTQGAFAFTEHKDGSITFTAEEAHSVGAYIRHLQLEIIRLEDELRVEKGRRCL